MVILSEINLKKRKYYNYFNVLEVNKLNIENKLIIHIFFYYL